MPPPISVLLVEDDASIEAALSDLLAGMDMTVVRTERGEEGTIGWLGTHSKSWQLAIVDININDGSGFGVVRRLRKDNPLGRIIVFTKVVTPLLQSQCISFGAEAAFSKGNLDGLMRFLRGGTLGDSPAATS